MSSFWRKNKNILVLAALLVLHLILISVQVPLGEEENYFERAVFIISSPIQHGIVSIAQGIGKVWRGYFDLREAHVENEKMKNELFYLAQENNLLKNALKHYKSEKEIRELLKRVHDNILYARVVGLDASNFNKSVIINKGSMDGIQKNMVILDKSGYLVGRVIGPISWKEARVQLITDSDCGVSVFTHREKALGILKGDGKGMCELHHILSTDTGIFEGDTLETSGFDGLFPPGIKVGAIVSIQQKDSLFKDVSVKPFFEFRSLDHLAVVKIQAKDLF